MNETNIVTKIRFKPRSNLKRSLQYRPLVRIFFYGNLIPLLFYCFFFAHDFWKRLEEGQTFLSAFQWFQWLCLGIWFFLLFLIIRPAMQTTVHVHPLGFSLERKGKKKEIPFIEMQELILPRNSLEELLMPGFFAVKMASGRSHYFTIALERSEYLLEAIASQRPQIVDLAAVEKFRATAISRDHSWAHQKDTLKKYPWKMLFKILGVPLIQVGLFLGYTGLDRESENQVRILTPLLYFFLVDLGIILFNEFLRGLAVFKIQRQALNQDPTAVIRNLPLEAQLVRRYEFVFWGLVLFATLAYWVYTFAEFT